MIKDIKASCVSRHLSSFETQMCVFLQGAGTFAAQPRLGTNPEFKVARWKRRLGCGNDANLYIIYYSFFKWAVQSSI